MTATTNVAVDEQPPWYAVTHDDDRHPVDELAARRRARNHWDHDAELGIIGAYIAVPLAERATIAASVSAVDFTLERNRLLWTALEPLAGYDAPITPAVVADALGPQLANVGHDAIRSIYEQASSLNWTHWVNILRGHTRTRQALAAAAELHEAIHTGRDWTDAIGRLEAVQAPTRGRAPSPDIDTFLNADEPEYDWIVPGLLERGDRVIVTGHEGKGKSTLLRQIAVTVAAGLHPFTHSPIEPHTVLIVDVENNDRQVRRKIRPLRISAGRDLDPHNVRIECKPEGLDLLERHDREWLADVVAANEPDILITGPIYKMASGDPKDEEPAKAVSSYFDRLRTQHGFALILEAHQPHPSGQSTKRAIRPFGASLWMRWPEFGLHLAEGGQLQHFRGERDERDWPAALKRGGDWPWTAITDAKALTFARLMDIVQELGEIPSKRELARLTSSSQQTIARAISANQNQWDAFTAQFTQGGDQ